MTQKNIDMMDAVVSSLAHGKTISQALKTVYTKRTVRLPYNEKVLETPIEKLTVSSRTHNALMRAHFQTIKEAVEYISTEGIMKIRNFGKVCAVELFESILNYHWDQMTNDEKTKFLIDTVERNQHHIKPELA